MSMPRASAHCSRVGLAERGEVRAVNDGCMAEKANVRLPQWLLVLRPAAR